MQLLTKRVDNKLSSEESNFMKTFHMNGFRATLLPRQQESNIDIMKSLDNLNITNVNFLYGESKHLYNNLSKVSQRCRFYIH